MARTKQTARKSTSSAPRVQLASKALRNELIVLSSDNESPGEEDQPAPRDPSQPVESTQWGATMEGPSRKEVFKGKWPFGGKGKSSDVPNPSGSVCKQISEVLARADNNAGEYSFGGLADTLPAVPGLEVRDVGPISVPLCPEQADKLIAKCDKSPFGRKLDTLMDENVRKSWQLAPDQVDIKNPLWHSGMDTLSEVIAGRLGYKGVPLQCKLYKLLVYGEGGQFVKHQDTEKEDGMVATLVVQLPSLHEGGDLVVYRGGKEVQRHDFGKKDGTAAYLPQYAVHYADAEHGLEKVTKGYRLVLVYSISLPPAMRHLTKSSDDSLGEELGSFISGMEADENSFALLLAHEYTEKSIEEFGSGSFKGIDRTRFQTLEEANRFAAPDKKLQLFIAQLKHDIDYWDDGGSWEENRRDESITWYSPSGEKLGDYPESNFQLNLLNPGKETFSAFWANHGTSTFEGNLGNEGATRKTTYSRYAIVAWPVVHGVKNAFEFINVNAAARALQAQKPVGSANIRNFLDDVNSKLEETQHSYSRSQSNTISISFCKILCELLVEAGDPAPVNLFFHKFLGRLVGQRSRIVDSLAALTRNFDWGDIGQALVEVLSKMDENERREWSNIEAVSSCGMEIALRVADTLDEGPAQQSLLKAAVRKTASLPDKYLSAFVVIGLLWKWAIKCCEKTLFDTVATRFQMMKPNFLHSAIEAFSQHIGDLDESSEKLSALKSIVETRIQWLNDQLMALGKPFSWEMPDASFPDNAQVQAFLRGPRASMNSSGIIQFSRLDRARSYTYNCKRTNASFTMAAGGRGRNAYVTITKTSDWFSQHQKDLVDYQAEVKRLSERFIATDSGARKRARYE
ncbi:hypothetical protein KRP22_002166 [Phytophthora ramorum]|nr:hypothetical protein KRP22_1449 [Phytophthora ramorum]